MYKYCINTVSISEWKSMGLSDEIIKPPDISIAPTAKYSGKKVA